MGELFLTTIEQTDGEGAGDLKAGTISYGLRSDNEYRTLLARWNDAGIQYFRGRALPAKKLAASFAAAK